MEFLEKGHPIGIREPHVHQSQFKRILMKAAPGFTHWSRQFVQYAANLPQQWLPNTVGRYRNSDPVLTNYLNRLGIEKMGRYITLFRGRCLIKLAFGR